MHDETGFKVQDREGEVEYLLFLSQLAEDAPPCKFIITLQDFTCIILAHSACMWLADNISKSATRAQ